MAKREDYFIGDESEIFIPDCNQCKHYLGKSKCEAFPGGIPDDIIMDGVKHTKVRKDQDGNYVFERKAK